MQKCGMGGDKSLVNKILIRKLVFRLQLELSVFKTAGVALYFRREGVWHSGGKNILENHKWRAKI